ncbi:MAG: cysteine desulfurase [Bacteroidia bacterium]|nr:cysteine desulfurase [Bacteroidia bacterium]MCZ2277955.1 cysteine desulfurase [Bacteroidia bacterium]
MNKSIPVYLDNNATTPVDPKVLEAMLPFFKEHYGNAASRTHSFGWVADEAVEIAREQIAHLIGAEKREIIFTSGATEAINLALKGLLELNYSERNHLITCKTEHKAVLDTCEWLSRHGADVTYLDVNKEGLIDINQLREQMTPKTLAVCIMIANNETGVIQPINEISEICLKKQVYFFTDATQAAGKIHLNVSQPHIDLLCLSAHKLYGPKGIGALYIRKKHPHVSLLAQIHGGGHENGLRSGTLNVPAIVGFGKACELVAEQSASELMQIAELRNWFEDSITQGGNAFVNGSKKMRLPNTSNLCFKAINSTEFIKAFPQLAVSTGSACTSASNEPSHVLKAMNLSDSESKNSIRFSLGRFTTAGQIETAIRLIGERVRL